MSICASGSERARTSGLSACSWAGLVGQAWAKSLVCALQGQDSAADVSTDEDGDEEEDEEDADSEEADDEEWDPSLATPAVGRRRRARSDSQEATVGLSAAF